MREIGGVAQLGERLPCTQEVIGSNPFTSTMLFKATMLSNLFHLHFYQFIELTTGGGAIWPSGCQLDNCKSSVCDDLRAL